MEKKIYQSMVFGIALLSLNIYADAPDQTGTGCANGTQYCENNNLSTTNTTTTTNTNTNTNTNNNTNTNTNNNTNTNTTTTTSTATNSNTNVNTNTNANTNVNTSTSTATTTATTNNTNANTNTNVNTSTSTSNSTVNSTVNQNVTNSTTSSNTNTNVNTSNSTSNSTANNTNTNVNSSTSESNVTTDNRNVNENNTTANNTNTNINQSNSTQTIKQEIKSEAPPASAIAPSIMSYSQDLCTTGRSGAFQGQVFGISGGRTVRDENCERLKLSKYIYDMGMKVAAVSILCQDERVFQAMEMAGTPCPYMGKIGKDASDGWKSNPAKRPDAKEYKANWIEQCKKGLNPNDTGYNKDIVSGVRKVLTKSTKTTRQCKREWRNAT
jgi:DNA polymerase III alpha subunit (gram-positive type)